MPLCGNSSVDRALAFQAGGRGFEPRFPLLARCYSSVVEHFLGKEEVLSSNLSNSSSENVDLNRSFIYNYNKEKLWLKRILCAPNRT